MTKKTIYIEAIDTLFFRDGKPFFMGDETWADVVFPPLPSVIYGALRSTYAFQQISRNITKTFEKAIEESSDLRIHNIYLVMDTQECFPFPLDLIKFKKPQNNREIYYLKKTAHLTASCDLAYLLMLDKALKSEKLDELTRIGFLPKNDFEEYLLANESDIKNVRKLLEYLTSEPKVGIGRDNQTRTTSGEAEGKMYRVNMQRLEKWSKNHKIRLVVEISGLDIEDSGIIKLGGEGKVAKYNIGKDYKFQLDTNKIQTNELKLYLSTPAIFQNTEQGKGNLPQWLIDKNFDGIDVELVASAIGKIQYVGGFDMQAQKPKRMFKAVPAGSVYYLQTNSAEDAKALAEKLQAKNSIAENGTFSTENFIEQGFGKFYLGLVQS